MGKGLESFEDLRNDGIRYLRLRWASVRLRIVDGISTVLNRIYAYFIFILLIIVASVFLMVALSLWLGEVLGHISLGFLISGGVFLAAGLIAYLLRDRLIVDSLVRFFSDMFFKDDRNGTKE